MKLEEAFRKYPDETLMIRKSNMDYFINHVNNSSTYKDATQEEKNAAIDQYSKNKFYHKKISFLKQLYAWGNEESRRMGFGIPDFMIEDAKADDWQIVGEN
jgi:hypothetical protein